MSRAGVNLRGKVVLLSGAGRPLGRTLVEAFARAGADLALHDLMPNERDGDSVAFCVPLRVMFSSSARRKGSGSAPAGPMRSRAASASSRTLRTSGLPSRAMASRTSRTGWLATMIEYLISAARASGGGGSGAGDGKCFDALPCFSEGAGAEVDRATCSIAEPVTGIGTNVALVMPPKSAGICGPDACLIPLDAHSATGWQSEAGRIVLPSAVCDRLENKQIVAVAVTTACETKTESIPLCGPWSSVIEKPGDFDAKGPAVEQLRDDASTQDTTEPPDAEPDTDGGTTPHEVPGPSCKDMTGKECEGKDCCSPILLPGSSFPMGRSQNGNDVCPSNESCEADEQPEHTVKLSEYYLDEFEVTVGRFRRFVDQFDGTPPAKGDGAHPAIPGSGWQSGWNSNLPASKAALLTELNCDSLYQTWRDTPNGTEQLPINCVSWPVAGGVRRTHQRSNTAAKPGSPTR